MLKNKIDFKMYKNLVCNKGFNTLYFQYYIEKEISNTLLIDLDSSSTLIWYISNGHSMTKEIPIISELSEDEFFQYLLLWEYKFDIYLAIEIQNLVKEYNYNFSVNYTRIINE